MSSILRIYTVSMFTDMQTISNCMITACHATRIFSPTDSPTVLTTYGNGCPETVFDWIPLKRRLSGWGPDNESRRWNPDEWWSQGSKSKRLITSGILVWSWMPVWPSLTTFPDWCVQATTTFDSSVESEGPSQQTPAIHSFGLSSTPGSTIAMAWWAASPCSFSTNSMEWWERPPDSYFSSRGWAPSHLLYVSDCTGWTFGCRIKFKLCVLAYRCLHGTAPVYLSRYIVPVSSVAGCSQLRSASSGLLCVPASKTVLGSRSFAISCPSAWNSLPSDIRCTDLSLPTFRKKLKTHLFSIWGFNNYCFSNL